MNKINIKVQLFTNQELVSCLKKNEFPENVVSFIEENNFSGEKLLDLSEFQIRNLKLANKQLEKSLWECIHKLKTEQLQFEEMKKVNISRKVSFASNRTNVIAKLEQIHKISPVTLTKNSKDLPSAKPSSTSPDLDDTPGSYIEMTRTPPRSKKPIIMKKPEILASSEIEEDYLEPIQINPRRAINKISEQDVEKLNLRGKITLNRSKPPNKPLPDSPNGFETQLEFPKSDQLEEELNEYAEINEKVEIQNRKPLAPPRKCSLEHKSVLYGNSGDDSSDTESDKRFKHFESSTRNDVSKKKDDKIQTFIKGSMRKINYSNRPLPPLPPPSNESIIKDEIQEDRIYVNDIQDLPEYENFNTENVAKKNDKTSIKQAIDLPEYINTVGGSEELRKTDKNITQKTFQQNTTRISMLGVEVREKSRKKIQETDKNAELKHNHDKTTKPQLKKLDLPKPPSIVSEDISNKMGKVLVEQLDDEEEAEYENLEVNLNNEPFFRNTDRRGAKLLLNQYEDGVFLVRPSKSFFVTLSVKITDGDTKEVKHVGIKRNNGKFRLDSVDDTSPEFNSLKELLKHFQHAKLNLPNNIDVVLKPLLPRDVF